MSTSKSVRELTYQFGFEGEESWRYLLQFDEEQRLISSETSREPRAWTALEFNKCSHCPLNSQSSPQCPVAKNLDAVIEDSKNAVSFVRATVTVTTPERTYIKECATQDGLRSLFGLVMASSGCPHLEWFRPSARFHLPFASLDETLYRTLSSHLLELYFSGEANLANCKSSIQDRYQKVKLVNRAFMGRVRSYCRADADKNAIAALDIFAEMFQFQAESDFSSLRKYFRFG